MNPPWTIERNSHRAYVLRSTLKRVHEQFRVLYLSDLHWDNRFCDRDLLLEHLELAKEWNCPIFLVGDTLCLMQGKFDKRADGSQIRPEHAGRNDYLDAVSVDLGNFLKPYAKQIAWMGQGNHEIEVIKRHSINPLAHAFGILKHAGCPGHLAGYWAFCKNIFMESDNGPHYFKTVHLHHGYGGGGEVTQGWIDHSRTRGQYWADLYISGHIHRRNYQPMVVTRMNQHNNVTEEEVIHLRCGTYKNEHMGALLPGNGDIDETTMIDWHATKGRAGRPLGGWFVDFQHCRKEINKKKFRWVSINPHHMPPTAPSVKL